MPQAVSTQSTTVAAATSDDVGKLTQWKALTDKFDEARMRKHEWQYDTDYMPFYRFQQVTRICDIWTEWSTGLNGFLPVRHLNEGWGARWRRGDRGQGTENCRRTRLVELIEKLIAKPGWDLALAQRFLRERYEGTTTPRKFCDYIQKNNGAGLQEVLRAASSYPT
jgi:Transcriptional activator of glycolytic enzymes